MGKEEKQSQILNAAYKVFATNQYKKAPTSEIAAEAGISKSLLFHYFHNKLELYLFLWNHAADLIRVILGVKERKQKRNESMKRIDFEHGTITGNILGAELPMLVARRLSL